MAEKILVYGASGSLYGGIESFLMTMQEHMSPHCIFDYVMVGDTCIHTKRILARGGTVFLVPSFRHNPLLFFIESWKVAKTARKDHAVSYINLFSMCHITSILMSFLLGYRIVLHAHNNDIPNKSRWYRAFHCFCRWLLGSLPCIRLTNSKDSALFMFGKRVVEQKPVELIYNAIEVEQFCFSPETRTEVRKALQLENQFVVGFVGRLSTQKNPLFLMDIFSCIHQRHPQAALLVIGEGEYRSAMEKQAEEQGLSHCVHFLGRRDDVPKLYCAMDCFVLPSLFEGLGIVLVEAQAAGLSCFASAQVIPSFVQFSKDLLHFLPLQAPAAAWADAVLSKTAAAPDHRQDWNDIVAQSPFQIKTEAKRLERRLLS